MDENNEKETEQRQATLWASIKAEVSNFLDIRQETDREATLESIKADISFRGHTAWVLVCSIFVASVGLNANSTAVVIGAMLISPLMGPILGIALALAINDVDLLRRALKNFSVMVVLSIFAAFLFFWLFPLRDTSSELLARTKPDIRDVLIAFFGGLALVIARTKKGTIASVIFGVAIATALMPPLCTVGFGLAIGNLNFAFGAMYLFIINTIFIALATFLVLRVVGMPMVHYATSSKRRRISNIAYTLAVLVMIPAGYTFWQVLKQSQFDNSARRFISENVATFSFPNRGSRFLSELSKFNYNEGENSFIELVFIGDEPIPENVLQTWEIQKQKYNMLGNVELKIIENTKGKGSGAYIEELYNANKEDLQSSKIRILTLEKEIDKLNQYSKEALLFEQISKEIAVNYEQIASVAYAKELISDFKKMDTVPIFRVAWKQAVNKPEAEKQKKKLQEWLRLKLDNDRVIVREM
ncbi:MAG: TIGR00341 family protein [Capnocytophaga sp.]|nr:TIGR00341 family protein [Capnocytophaga sp.]